MNNDNLTERLRNSKEKNDFNISSDEATKIANELLTEDEFIEKSLEDEINNGTFNIRDNSMAQKMRESRVNIQPDINIDDGMEQDHTDKIVPETKNIIHKPDIEEDKPLTPEERVEAAKRKYNSIHVHEEEKHEPKISDNMDSDLADALSDIDKDNEKNIRLINKMENYDKMYEKLDEIPSHNSSGLNSDVDEVIMDIQEKIENDEVNKDDEKNDQEEDLENMLAAIESEKMYADVKPNDIIAGPSNYIIERDEEYAYAIEDVLKSNNINIVRKNAKERNAILDRFVNSGDNVTMILPNSGIYVTVSGAGTTEIIAMQEMDQGDSEMHAELSKLDHICQHITGSSIGRMKLSQLIKVVSYFDRDSLYYAFFAGTHPNMSEYSKTCNKCRKDYYMKIHTKDLMLNPEDFAEEAEDIKNNVTTYERLLKTSKLGKLFVQTHKNGLIVEYKHPSIESYLTTKNKITPENINKYSQLLEFVYCISKIRLHVKNNDFIEYTDPNEILEVLSKIKDIDVKYEIYDTITKLRPNDIPTYGFKETTCPYCGAKNDMTTFSMESLLFTKAQQEEYMATLKWAAKLQKRKNKKKK